MADPTFEERQHISAVLALADQLEDRVERFEVARDDVGRWNYDHVESPWHVAFTPGLRARDVTIDGEPVVRDGVPTRVDVAEVRAKAAEQATRLFATLVDH